MNKVSALPESRFPTVARPLWPSARAVHYALESWDLTADLESGFAEQLERARRYLENLLGETDVEAGKQEIAEIFSRLQNGTLLKRLLASPEFVAARELPILMPPASDEGSEPIAGVSGTVDLLLRDSDGDYTVIYFKTDRVESEDAMRSRAEIYAPQLATYARAIGESLGLDKLPNTEIWFLWPHRSWSVACRS